ncbi:AgmX/PglI C-terminal domain-containing protein [bacterium]|nr:AgmX/PglI C-terminal domain-containing protein [bacterium]
MAHVLEIQVFDEDKLLVKASFDQSKIVIGRILSADFRVPDSRISRIHALLERLDDGTVRITDLASTHGTSVNGERVIERVIGPADEVKLAGLKLQMNYRTTVPREAAEFPAAANVIPQSVQSPKADQPQAPIAPMPSSAPQVKVKENRDPTVIRSLKDSARGRGVLSASARPSSELEVTVYWEETVLNVDHCRQRKKTIRIGEAEGNDYVVASHVLPAHFDFIKVNGSEAEIQLHPSMRGSARVSGDVIRLEDDPESKAALPTSVRISGSDIAKIQVGSVHFFLMFVGEPPAIPRDDIFDQGRLFWFLQIFLSLVGLAMIAFSSMWKPAIEGRVKEFPERFRRVIVQTYKAQTKQIQGPKAVTGAKTQNAEKVTKTATQGGNEGAGSKAKGPEGTKGVETAKKKTGVNNRKAVKKPIVKKRPQPTETPAESILSTLKNSGLSGKLAKSSGTPSLDEAFQGVGGSSGSSQGSGGKGLQGGARGGSGQTAGAGGLGTSGFSSGASGTGAGSVPGKGEVAISTESVNVYVLGSLTAEEIKRVVDAHENEVQYCLNQALKLDPGISGRVEISWTIFGQGQVRNTKVAQNTTGSEALATCIMRYLKTWTFPKPASGSTADVSFPWIVKPKGS